jgi:N-acetylglutamate synthase-like GNAT family acetyltransferase
MIVAYVFWHRPRPDADAGPYADALARFHAALGAEPPAGLLASWAVRIDAAPWPGAGEGWFEDWYVLRGLAALGGLERAAVDARRRDTHDAAAAGTGEGTAGLYGLVAGDPLAAGAPAAESWLAKPDGEPYKRFVPALADAAGAGASVWQRRLVLGPTPEFAVLGPGPLAGPWPTITGAADAVVAPAGRNAAPGPVLRDATVEDAAALSALALRSKAHWGYDDEFLRRAQPELTVTAEDVERFVVRVAEREGAPLGFSAVDLGSTPAELLALWVDPPAIATGVGRALLRDALATAAAQAAGGLLVESDPNAEGFYVRHGARLLGERRSPTTKRLLPLLWLPA